MRPTAPDLAAGDGRGIDALEVDASATRRHVAGRRRRLGRLALGVALLAVVAAVVAHRLWGEVRGVEATLTHAFHLDARWLGATWLVQTAGGLVMVDTWRRIVERFGVRAPLARHARRYAYAALAHVIPGGIWTPLGRLAAYGRADAVAVGLATAIEWVVLGTAGLVLYAATLPWAAAGPPVGVWVLVAAAFVGGVAVQPGVFHRLVAAAGRMAGRPDVGAALPALEARDLAAWLGRALLVLGLSGASLYGFMRAVSPTASLADAVGIGGLTVALGNLVGPLPLTGLVKDLGMVLLLAPLYGSSAVALGLVVAWRVWMIVVEATWAVLATIWARRAGPGTRP